MNAPIKPFLFEEDFGERAGTRRQDVEALKAAAEDAYQRGLTDGRRQAQDEIAARLAQALEHVAGRADAVFAALGQETERLEREAAGLAEAFARKLAGVLVDAAPLGLLREAASDCFRHLALQPHVVARVPEALADQAKAALETIAAERGLSGRLVILGEAGLDAGDFSIEWADGGIQRHGAALEKAVVEAIRRHFDSAE